MHRKKGLDFDPSQRSTSCPSFCWRYEDAVGLETMDLGHMAKDISPDEANRGWWLIAVGDGDGAKPAVMTALANDISEPSWAVPQ